MSFAGAVVNVCCHLFCDGCFQVVMDLGRLLADCLNKGRHDFIKQLLDIQFCLLSDSRWCRCCWWVMFGLGDGRIVSSCVMMRQGEAVCLLFLFHLFKLLSDFMEDCVGVFHLFVTFLVSFL